MEEGFSVLRTCRPAAARVAEGREPLALCIARNYNIVCNISAYIIYTLPLRFSFRL